MLVEQINSILNNNFAILISVAFGFMSLIFIWLILKKEIKSVGTFIKIAIIPTMIIVIVSLFVFSVHVATEQKDSIASLIERYIVDHSSMELNSILAQSDIIEEDQALDVAKAIDKSIGDTQLVEASEIIKDNFYDYIILRNGINKAISQINSNKKKEALLKQINEIEENKNDKSRSN